ncbi:HprK-related kinase A [Motilimonas sp. E26]|uniref:HprK-related kinase A n=1 Tax=Motilimonas TaxID=1914248 RepID=UPI001E5C4424|nr:HprK-related kinase A [Motilimonas sp. E26]MCE0556629.1 HprK-related kinase A [Motilimonas sp. E26]
MLKLAAYPEQVRAALKQQGLFLSLPPFVIQVRCSSNALADYFTRIYANHEFFPQPQVASFNIELKHERGLRRWLKPQIRFYQNEHAPFYSMPESHAPILWEWGLNYCIAAKYHACLTIHAAVVAKNGEALVIPAPPGSGKSTLCALLCSHGWQLLSDEFALIDLSSQQVQALPRPISLKNQSIDVLREYVEKTQSHGRFSAEFLGTSKGRVALYSVPSEQLAQNQQSYPIKRVLFPRYCQGLHCEVTPISPAQCLMQLADNSFNFAVLGQAAFICLAEVVASSHAYSVDYGNFNALLAQLDTLP